MRTIEFRGLRTDGKGWISGCYYFDGVENVRYINEWYNSTPESETGHSELLMRWVPVNPSTVGQFTGLYDKNGVKVFEGDTVVTDCVLVFGEPVDGFAGVVKYLECCFYIDSGIDAMKVWSDAYQVEVTGNIHEPATVRE